MTVPPTLFQKATSTRIKGSPELFKELTGAEWIDQIKVEDSLSILHIPPTPSESEMMRFLKPAYAHYQKSPLKLCLYDTDKAGAYTLHAQEPIEKGTIVTEYLGEWSQQSNRYSSYRWGPIDALNFRNCGGMVEDGFPNLAAFHLYGINGLPLRILFIALDNISAEEMVVINYGMSHSVKINYHTEYRLEAMAEFFSRHPLDQLFKTIGISISRKRAELGWNKCLELEGLIAKIQYLYQTPSALIHLFIKNVISPKDAFNHLDRIDNRFYVLGFPLNPNRRQKEILDDLQLLKTYFLGQRLHDATLLQLIGQIRIRVAIQIFLKGVLENGDAEFYLQESYFINSALDAVSECDHAKFLFQLNLTKLRDLLLEEANLYAREIKSQAVSWFNTNDLQ